VSVIFNQGENSVMFIFAVSGTDLWCGGGVVVDRVLTL
jgi:hypothetical protein